MMPHPHTLVAGIGNIFLGDDGFGCEVVRALADKDIPAGVKVVDYGIRGLDLAYALLEPYATVILIDTVARGRTPGTVYLLEPADSSATDNTALDPHSMDLLHLMAMANSLGEITARIIIVGCEPFDFGDELAGRMGLSEPVARAVPEGAQAVLDIIHQKHPHRAQLSSTLSAAASSLQGESL